MLRPWRRLERNSKPRARRHRMKRGFGGSYRSRQGWFASAIGVISTVGCPESLRTSLPSPAWACHAGGGRNVGASPDISDGQRGGHLRGVEEVRQIPLREGCPFEHLPFRAPGKGRFTRRLKAKRPERDGKAKASWPDAILPLIASLQCLPATISPAPASPRAAERRRT